MNRKPVALFTVLFLALSGMLFLSNSAFAHHGASAYSESLTVVKDGTVTKFQWGNPHSIVFFDAKDAGGKVLHWAVEAGSPSALSLIGWSKNALQPGDK